MKSSKPKISVVTPSFNQGKFIEKNILSVINQDYENYEHIIIDGGSTDESVSVIKKYEDSILYWVSEEDNGQADALNKGFEKTNGEILCWLNSDDVFLPGTFDTIARLSKPLSGPFFITGDCRFIKSGKIEWEAPHSNQNTLTKLDYTNVDLLKCWKYSLAQPSTFWSKEVYGLIGNIDQSLYFAMDLEYWLRGLKNKIPFYYCPQNFSEFLYHENSKSTNDVERLYSDLSMLSKKYILNKDDLKKYNTELNRWKNCYHLLSNAREKVNIDKTSSLKLIFKAIRFHPAILFKRFKLVLFIVRSLIFSR